MTITFITRSARKDDPAGKVVTLKREVSASYLCKGGLVAARREGKWMHYRVERSEDAAVASILDSALESLKTDREMQSDLDRLGQTCCQPERFVSLQGAPIPPLVL
jgi:ArsR family transcriptional regulator, arsenate/arsenite/antimonite-responsive transcriptional repressor